MRVKHLTLAALGVLILAPHAMACSAEPGTAPTCTMPLTIINVGDGFNITPRPHIAIGFPGNSVQIPVALSPSPPPRRLGSTVWLDDQLARLPAGPSRPLERGQ